MYLHNGQFLGSEYRMTKHWPSSDIRSSALSTEQAEHISAALADSWSFETLIVELWCQELDTRITRYVLIL